MSYKKKPWQKLITKNYSVIILLGLLILPGVWSLFQPNFFHTHDGEAHLARMAAFYKAIKAGHIPPRWASDLYYGLGYPIFIFHPILAYSLGAPLIATGIPLFESLKILLFLASLFSAVFMFIWLKEFLEKSAALLGALFYFYAPYRFLDLYVRGAIGEVLAFTFIPLVFYFIHRCFKSSEYQLLLKGGVAYCLAILSHQGLALIFSPLFTLYILLLMLTDRSKYPKEKLIKKTLGCFIMLLFGLLFSAFSWLPMILENQFIKRKLMFAAFYKNHFVYLHQFFQENWGWGGSEPGIAKDGMSFAVGIPQWIVALLAPITFWKSGKQKQKMIIFFLFLFAMSLFLMTKPSQLLWEVFPLIKNLQFPWRLLSINLFSAAVLAAFLFEILPLKKIIFIFFIFSLLIFSKNQWKTNLQVTHSESHYYHYQHSTSTFGENDPVWIKQIPNQKPVDYFSIVRGDGIISSQNRQTLAHNLNVFGNTDLIVEDKTLYFPGWRVYLDNQEIPQTEIIKFLSPLGTIRSSAPPGNHQISIIFQKTSVRLMADILSSISIALASLALIIYHLGIRVLKNHD